MERYQIRHESLSGSWCFEATVIDTTPSEPQHRDGTATVCECLDMEDARLVCNALNAYDKAERNG